MNSPFGLYAATASGPRLLAGAPGGAGVHDLFDGLPLGAYSGFRSFPGGRFLDFEGHLERTARSLHLLGLDPDFDRDAARLALRRLVDDHAGAAFRFRLEVLPSPIDTEHDPARVLVGLGPLTTLPAELLAGGVKLGLAPELTRSVPRAKSSAFAARRRPHPLYARDDYDRLLTDLEGRVLEGTSCNAVFLRGDTLVTAGDGVLEGITLKYVASLARKAGAAVRFDFPRLDELARYDGAFVTSSARGVVPVVAVDDRPLGDGRVHPLARALARDYDDFALAAARPITLTEN